MLFKFIYDSCRWNAKQISPSYANKCLMALLLKIKKCFTYFHSHNFGLTLLIIE